MRLEIDVSLTELTKAAGVLVGELKRLGMEIRLDQALAILSALLATFRGSKKDEEKDEGPVYPSSTSAKKKKNDEGKEGEPD